MTELILIIVGVAFVLNLLFLGYVVFIENEDDC